MLRQVEAIGKTGRNWPIRDGNAQTKLVASSVAAIGREASARDSRSSNGSRGFDEPMTHRAKSSQSRGRDAHDLFTHPDEERQPSEGPSVATRNSVKPPVRQLDELVGEPSESRGIRSPSPSKQEGTVLKAGAGKNFNPSRLFDPNEPDDRSQSPERRKAMPNKYNHFEFANSEDGDSRPPSGKTKNQMTTHWDFDDFTTPEKVQPKPQREQERHIGFGIDEVRPNHPTSTPFKSPVQSLIHSQDDPKSPPKRPIVHAARPDVESHFNMSDKSSPVPSQRPSSKGGRPGVFSNHVTQGASDPEPLANITSTTNIDNSRRREDSEPHWSMSTPVPEKKIYKTAGNGMGGRKENSLHWSLGGDNDEPEQKIYKTSGNGMGGRSSTARSWAIGDDFDAEDAAADRRKTEASKSRRGFERSGF